MIRASAPLIILSALSAGCSDSNPAATSAHMPFTVTDLTVGMGAAATNGPVLTVNYAGWLDDFGTPDNKGVVFDSTAGRPSFAFTLGVGQVIQG